MPRARPFLRTLLTSVILAAPLPAAADTSPLLAPGLWCAEYQPDTHSCALVREVEARPGNAAHVRQLSLGRARDGGAQKVVMNLPVERSAAGFCYDAGFIVLDGVQLYASRDAAAQLSTTDVPVPAALVAHALSRIGLPAALDGKRLCLAMPAEEWSLIPPAQTAALVLRTP